MPKKPKRQKCPECGGGIDFIIAIPIGRAPQSAEERKDLASDRAKRDEEARRNGYDPRAFYRDQN